MTMWPEPEREREPARPPRGPRPPGQSRFHIPTEDRWMWFGVVLSGLFLAAFVGYFTHWFGLTAPPPDPNDASAPGGPHGPFIHSFVGDLAFAVALGLVVGGVAWWILRGLRSDATKLEDLPADEQARRREAARLLQEVVPPVSEAEAVEALRPSWLQELGPRPATETPGASPPDPPT